ncbi:MAG: hypothetical protein V5A68_04985, partial [Candidatus Thermoplasmatota archaeon]
IIIALLAYFSTVWVLYELVIKSEQMIFALGIIFVILAILLLLSYILMTILEWINLFEYNINALVTLIVLSSMMITFDLYLIMNYLVGS